MPRFVRDNNPVGRLATGEEVYDRPGRVNRVPHHLLVEALAKVNSGGPRDSRSIVDFGRVIGKNNLVETFPGDRIIYARRQRQNRMSRFVGNRLPEPCSTVVLFLSRRSKGYVLGDAYIGNLAEPETDSPNATPESAAFWKTHALVWGSEFTVPGSEIVEP